MAQTEIAKVGHTPAVAVIENIKYSTCKEKGGYDSVVYCSVCGEKISSETVSFDLAAHSEIDVPAVAPTCTATGLTSGNA